MPHPGYLIDNFRTYKAVLAQIKQEYDGYVDHLTSENRRMYEGVTGGMLGQA